MPASHAARLRRRWALGSVVTAAAAAAAVVAVSMSSGASASEVALPPVHGGFDYQIGGAYTPP